MDAPTAPIPKLAATYNGDSVGHWEGDTLVVDVTRLTDETWLGDNGLFTAGNCTSRNGCGGSATRFSTR